MRRDLGHLLSGRDEETCRGVSIARPLLPALGRDAAVTPICACHPQSRCPVTSRASHYDCPGSAASRQEAVSTRLPGGRQGRSLRLRWRAEGLALPGTGLGLQLGRCLTPIGVARSLTCNSGIERGPIDIGAGIVRSRGEKNRFCRLWAYSGRGPDGSRCGVVFAGSAAVAFGLGFADDGFWVSA